MKRLPKVEDAAIIGSKSPRRCQNASDVRVDDPIDVLEFDEGVEEVPLWSRWLQQLMLKLLMMQLLLRIQKQQQ